MSGQRMASLEINYQEVEDALTPGELAYLPRGRIYATWYTPYGDMNRLLNYTSYFGATRVVTVVTHSHTSIP